mmetsp:Transcript_18216/g.53079  ORF Transcript_18216/g.53079 Transcript_18216/m.53079 type:complete len:222 (-) Transcript_18216:14-679(-)
MIAVGIIIAYLVFILVFAIGVCWLWPDFVDNNEPPRIRFALHCILFIQTAAELSMWFGGALKPWMLALVIFANFWGMLDAFLRFPIVHDIDSLFGLKQVLVIALKLTGYALGFRNVGKHVGWFVLSILCCVFTVPILWLTALPIGDITSYHQKHDAVDVDIAVRLWRVLRNPHDRSAALVQAKVLCRRSAVALVRLCPGLRPAALRLDPSLARVLRQKPAV